MPLALQSSNHVHLLPGRRAHRHCQFEFSDYRQWVTVIAQKLDQKLATWQPETANKVERLIEEIIELADGDALEILQSRAAVQEVLDELEAN